MSLRNEIAVRLAELFAASLDDVVPELAHHFELGADWTRAVKYLRRVARAPATTSRQRRSASAPDPRSSGGAESRYTSLRSRGFCLELWYCLS
jgi:hypothetical protein